MDNNCLPLGAVITSLKFSPSGEALVVGMDNGMVSVFKWKTKALTLQQTLDFSTQVCSLCATLPQRN